MTEKYPHIIGLTGSIGMGKSTISAMFKDAGVALFDADAEVHKLQAAGGALVDKIEAAFPGTTGPEGVDRAKLGSIVLDDPEKMAQLEGMIHPAVRESRTKFLAAHSDADMLVFDIPLLFETGGQDIVDSILVVSASPEQQRERVLARPGMTAEKFESILKLQMPDAEKRKQAHFVIDNSGSVAESRAQVEKLVDDLRNALATRQN